jgi:hypothetical protein
MVFIAYCFPERTGQKFVKFPGNSKGSGLVSVAL